ncbi:MAG: hypothetical protein ACYC6Y_05085 [Thermoguttaceae bacterium]
MSVQITEWLEVVGKILLRCWIFGFMLLFIWLGAFLSGAVHNLHGPLMDLAAHSEPVRILSGKMWLFVAGHPLYGRVPGNPS